MSSSEVVRKHRLREREERWLASRARDPATVAIHEELAARYAFMAEVAEAGGLARFRAIRGE